MIVFASIYENKFALIFDVLVFGWYYLDRERGTNLFLMNESKKKGRGRLFGQRGLTLFETILTMVILAILASLTMPNLMKGVEQKRADSAIETLRTISHCIRLYKLEHDLTDLPATGIKLGALDTEDASGITGNGCMDRNQFEGTFSFPERSSTVLGATVLTASDIRGSGRTVCLTPAGTLARNGTIYDVISGDCTAGNAFRTIKE